MNVKTTTATISSHLRCCRRLSRRRRWCHWNRGCRRGSGTRGSGTRGSGRGRYLIWTFGGSGTILIFSEKVENPLKIDLGEIMYRICLNLPYIHSS